MKQARIVMGKHTGRHPQGGAENGELHLRAGRRGMGKILHSVKYWPWSPRSCEAADRHLYAAAERLGYEIIPSCEE